MKSRKSYFSERVGHAERIGSSWCGYTASGNGSGVPCKLASRIYGSSSGREPRKFEKLVAKRQNSIDPSLSVEDKINSSLLKLKKKGKLSDGLYKALHSTGGMAPRLYGLAKTHKDGTPLRPVLSMCGSAYYQIASQMANGFPACDLKTNEVRLLF